MSDEYSHCVKDERSAYLHFKWDPEDQELIRIALDLCYRELAKRSEKLHSKTHESPVSS